MADRIIEAGNSLASFPTAADWFPVLGYANARLPGHTSSAGI